MDKARWKEGVDLSKEAIARVRDAEARANAIRAEAEARATQLREQEEKACADAREARLKETSADWKRKLAGVQEKADDLIRQSREEAGADAQALEEAASQHRREAVKVVVWEMLDSCR